MAPPTEAMQTVCMGLKEQYRASLRDWSDCLVALDECQGGSEQVELETAYEIAKVAVEDAEREYLEASAERCAGCSRELAEGRHLPVSEHGKECLWQWEK
jgi:hypothetical protein